ncbi:MAG: SEC-C metal-binding domain-containing protein [Isosphaeraceae bacterium]|nr:SEC-C metal-binding domain-containing protein [Isosphaeraceae bacterium]
MHMKRFGRNAPCRCGSGKKSKNCCGMLSGADSRSGLCSIIPSTEGNDQINPNASHAEVHLDVSAVSLPGLHATLTKTFEFSDGRSPGSPLGNPGEYRATLVLHRPGYPLDDSSRVLFEAHELEGESYIKLQFANTIKIQAQIVGSASPPLHAVVTRNSRGFIAKIHTETFIAQSFSDARTVAFQKLAPFLSVLSIEHNTPIDIYRIDVLEHATGSRQMDFIAPYPEHELVSLPNVVGDRFRAYASLYREALCSNSPAYSFLCLYRILEALTVDRKNRVQEARKNGNVPPSYRAWLVPSSEPQFIDWLNSLYRVRANWDAAVIGNFFPTETRGRKISMVMEKFLRPLRNKIAHSIFGESGKDIWEESLVNNHEVWNLLPLAQMIVRRMLKDEFPDEFLVGLPDDGLECLFANVSPPSGRRVEPGDAGR